MQPMIEGMWNKTEYDLKDSRKIAGQLEECSNSKLMKSVLNGRTFKYHLGGDRFNMISESYTFSHGICLNSFLQFLLIGIQKDQAHPFRYTNQEGEVYHLLRRMKLLESTKYLIRSLKLAAQEI